MAEYSFDVVSEHNPAELTNAIDQARREVSTRYDFKDTQTAYDHRGDVIIIESATEDRARAALQVLREKAARRQLSPKLFQAGGLTPVAAQRTESWSTANLGEAAGGPETADRAQILASLARRRGGSR